MEQTSSQILHPEHRSATTANFQDMFFSFYDSPGTHNLHFLPKGVITPLWPPSHRASLRGMSPSGAEPGLEGKEGRGEIFQCLCQINFKTPDNHFLFFHAMPYATSSLIPSQKLLEPFQFLRL